MNNLQRGHFWGHISVERWVNEFFCFCSLLYRRGAAVEEVNPPGRGIKRAVAVVKRWVDVVEEVPNCMILVLTDDGEGKERTVPYNDAAHLVFRQCTMHDQREGQQHPW